VTSLSTLPFNAILGFFGKKGSHTELNLASRGEGVGMAAILFSVRNSRRDKEEWARVSSRWRHQSIEFHFTRRLSFKRLWTDPNKIPNMLATSRMALLLFRRTCSFTWSTLTSLFLVDDVPNVRHLQRKSHYFWTGSTTQKLAFIPLSALQRLPFNI
jgi:hypothetical protein